MSRGLDYKPFREQHAVKSAGLMTFRISPEAGGGDVMKYVGPVPDLIEKYGKQVDLGANTISLNVGDTKNEEGRTVVMTTIVHALLTQAIVGKQPADYVFTRENGRRVLDFRRAWAKVCGKANQPGLLFHDLQDSSAKHGKGGSV